MNHDEIESENSNDSDPSPTIEMFDSLLSNINQDPLINEINQEVDENEILPNDKFCKAPTYYAECDSCSDFFDVFLYRFSDTFFFLILGLSFVFLFIAIIAFIFEAMISFYSVLMMNYIFFVSSMVSYTMAPIYQSLAGDWLNFIFSFTQVILASPLIAFYMFYISKSVKTLGSFIEDIPQVIQHISVIFVKGDKILFKELFTEYISNFFWNDFDFIYGCDEILVILLMFGASVGLLALAAALAYVQFCFDKTIILLGSICYVFNTLQILLLILPSYLYFFQTLLCIKCKEVGFVKNYINYLKDLYDEIKDDSESDKKNSKKSEFEELNSTESYSDESDSVVKNIFNNKKQKRENDDDDSDKKKKSDKLIDDSDISDLVDEDKEAEAKFSDLMNNLLGLVTANNYFCLYHYSKTIAFDKHHKCRKVVLMYIFFILNLSVISYDIYQLKQNYSAHFLASVIIRFLLIPLFSFYNITSFLLHRSKNLGLNVVLAISSILTIIIAIAIVLCYMFTDFYQTKYRINDLKYFPLLTNYTASDREMTKHTICDYKIFDVSAFDAFGYSLGGYDVKRNITIFDNQMKTFFDENYSSHISYKIHEIDEHFLFIKYFDSAINTHIFAFRGYNSGPEVAFQLEILATHYIIPFFEDIVPFYELINDYWLEFYTNFLSSFGLNFFENNNLMVKYVNSIVDIYNKADLENEDQVLFAGINCGGVFAKIVGTILHRKSISFISFPIDNDLFEMMFEFQPSYISLVTNVYNVDGFFSDQEPRFATNIGIDMPVFDSSKFCTSGICEINSKTDNVYRTFCTMSEICGKGNRFNYYCENVIGKDDLETIRESLKEND